MTSNEPLFRELRMWVCQHVSEREKLCKVLQEHGASVCDDLAQEATIYVMDTFAGETFDHLKTRGARIVGSACIYESVRSSKALPEAPHPVYSRALEGMEIVIWGCQDEDTWSDRVRFMSGTPARVVRTSTTCLVTAHINSSFYKAATRLGVPAVSEAWLRACWTQRDAPPMHKFALPPFLDQVISLTGFTGANRLMLERLITENGGVYSRDFSRRCSFLVALGPTGNKVACASVWGVPIVRMEWLLECVNHRACLDVSSFVILPTYKSLSSFQPLSTRASSASGLRASVDSTILRSPFRDDIRKDLRRPVSGPTSQQRAPPPLRLRRSAPAVPNPLRRPTRSLSDLAEPFEKSVRTKTTDELKPEEMNEAMVAHLRSILAQCERLTSAFLSVSNVCEILRACDPLVNPATRRACLCFVAKNFAEISVTTSYRSLSHGLRQQCATFAAAYLARTQAGEKEEEPARKRQRISGL